jgi:2'-5' RNA ligase
MVAQVGAGGEKAEGEGALPVARHGGESGADRPLRLFVAVELPDEVKQSLDEAIAVLRQAGADAGLAWVRPEAIHLTLKFLGPTPVARVPTITAALRQALEGATSFELRPDGPGTFHGGKNPHFTRRFPRESRHDNVRVLWVGVGPGAERLAELAGRVETALAPHGFPAERRPFAGHLTLARVREQADRATRERLWRALEPYVSRGTMVVGRFDPARVPRFPPFRVSGVTLIESTLTPAGAVYRAVETFALAAR